MIDNLTTEQEEQLEVYANKGIEIGVTTGVIPVEEAKTIAADAIEALQGKRPEKVEVYDSPVAAWDAVVAHTGVADKEYIHPYIDGHLFSYYFALCNYYIEVLGIELPDDVIKTHRLLEKTQRLGNVYPLDDICIVSQRPVKMEFVDKKLHCEDGPSIEYADGFRVYSLNGVRVPEWLAMTKWDKLDPKEFAKIKNVEIRREFVRKIGMERLILKLGGEVIDKQDDYELILIDLKGETGVWPYLKMKNPSIGVWHVECVGKDCKTVDQALEFRNQSKLKPEVLT